MGPTGIPSPRDEAGSCPTEARIEKRLAALMVDLAQHKGMTPGEMLEEMAVHSFEKVSGGDGVASPHTARTRALIHELKAKHGIDYNTHASYQFVERPESVG